LYSKIKIMWLNYYEPFVLGGFIGVYSLMHKKQENKSCLFIVQYNQCFKANQWIGTSSIYTIGSILYRKRKRKNWHYIYLVLDIWMYHTFTKTLQPSSNFSPCHISITWICHTLIFLFFITPYKNKVIRGNNV
jgi:hypothetical protein